MADVLAPLIVSIICQFFLPTQKPLIARSLALLSIGTSPSVRNTLPVGSNNVGFDVIGASPEECYGYAGPVGKSGSETTNDGESWWEKRHERMEELMKEQEKEAVKRAQARRKAVQNEYLNSQLAAAYEKSSIILPDNPVIL